MNEKQITKYLETGGNKILESDIRIKKDARRMGGKWIWRPQSSVRPLKPFSIGQITLFQVFIKYM